MAKANIGLGSVKRFGVRYGRTVKVKMAAIETMQRAKHKCPFCHKSQVRRVTAGVWQCEKCKVKFTGRAYEPSPSKTTEA
jgi:large subunit ribosomal protein L37Ae